MIDGSHSDLRKSKPEEKENALTQKKKRKEKAEQAETEAAPKSKGRKKQWPLFASPWILLRFSVGWDPGCLLWLT